MALPLIPNPTLPLLAQHANRDVQNVVAHGLVIKEVKDWLVPTLTMVAEET